MRFVLPVERKDESDDLAEELADADLSPAARGVFAVARVWRKVIDVVASFGFVVGVIATVATALSAFYGVLSAVVAVGCVAATVACVVVPRAVRGVERVLFRRLLAGPALPRSSVGMNAGVPALRDHND